MRTTLVLTEPIAAALSEAARARFESAGVLIATPMQTPDGGLRLLGRDFVWVDEAAYTVRERDALSIRSEGYVSALADAEGADAVAIWTHTHPAAAPLPSLADRAVDSDIADLFRMRTGSGRYGALIVSPNGAGLSFTGFVEDESGGLLAFDRLWTVGERLRLTPRYGAVWAGAGPQFDRNVRAFGGAVQSTLGDLHVGVVGCGGTGSAVVEQLARLGVRRFTLVDPDELSLSNVTRVYGSTPKDVGRAKVDVLANHVRAIAPEAECLRIRKTLMIQVAARAMTNCDIVFGCTDDNAGRLVLSRLASYTLTPVIDCGVLLSSSAAGVLEGIDARVTYLGPGQACLVCRGRIDVARAAAELMTPEERVRLADEGYAPALAGVEPAVVAFTTAVAAAAVADLLDRLTGYGPVPLPSETLLRLHDREISTNRALPREGHYCDPGAGKCGKGAAEPFLDQAWVR